VEFPIPLIIVFCGFWITMMVFDLRNTWNNRDAIEFENSFILNFFRKHTPLRNALIFVGICEVVLVMFSSVILLHSFNLQVSLTVGIVSAVIHINGITTTNKFLKAYNT